MFIHSLILVIYKHLDPNNVDWLTSNLLYQYDIFKPKIIVVTVIVTMMAGLLAISLPLTISGIERILDRYRSEVISQILKNKIEYKLSIGLGISVVFFLLIISVGVEESKDIIGIWKILYCIDILFFLGFIYTFFELLFTAAKYSNDSKFILEEFAQSNKNIIKILNKEKDLTEKELDKLQKQLRDNLEGIGDVLCFLSPRIKYNLYVIEQLDKLSKITKDFIELIQKHPERFAQISYSEQYRKISRQQDQDSQLLTWALEHAPEKQFVVFSILISNIASTYQEAYAQRNLIIMQEAIRFVIDFLKNLSTYPRQKAVIEYYLNELYYREFDCEGEEELEHYKTVYIYFEVVYKNDFNLKYLPLFDRYLFEQFKYIVEQNRVQSILNLSSTATSSYNIIPIDRYKLFKGYNKFNNTPKKLLDNLDIKLRKIHLKSEIDECCNDFDQLAELDNNKIKILDFQEDFYWTALAYYKYNHLRDLVFALGAYCVYQRKFNLIYELWEFNQPEDSTANNLNPAIVPTHCGEIVNHYFGVSLEQRTSAIYWDENHGKKRYYRLYLILCLVRSFSTPAGKVDISTVSLQWTRFSSSQISDIEFEIDNILENLQFLPRYKKHFQELKLSFPIVDYLVNNKVKPLLIHLKKQIPLAQNCLLLSSEISNTKIQEFELDFSQQYKNESQFKKIYIYYDYYQYKLNNKPDKNIDYFGLTREVKKDLFIENWHIEPFYDANWFAQLMAHKEDLYVFEQWKAKSINCSNNSLDIILSRVNNLEEMIIINVNLYSILIKKQLPDYYQNLTRINNKNFRQLFSTYSKNGIEIPIINFTIPGLPSDTIFIINKSFIGQWTQYCPLEYTKENPKNIFDIKIQGIANNINLRRYYHQLGKDILDKYYQEAQKKQDYLNSLVRIDIYQKFHLKIADNFEGYYIEIESP